MMCLPTALSKLLQSPSEEYFQFRKPPYTGVDLVYAAFQMGALLVPFVEHHEGVEYDIFDHAFLQYPGILCADLEDGRQHAYVKYPKCLWDAYGRYALNDNHHKNRVFFAWVNRTLHATG
jgi:hypothetical protein